MGGLVRNCFWCLYGALLLCPFGFALFVGTDEGFASDATWLFFLQFVTPLGFVPLFLGVSAGFLVTIVFSPRESDANGRA